jgi:predicted RNA methylase
VNAGLIGAGLCVLGAACMLAGLAVDLDSTAAKVLIASGAALFVPGVLLTFVWMRIRMGPPR